MESLMPPLAIEFLTENLQGSNSRLSQCLDHLDSEATPVTAQPSAATPRQIGTLLSELMRAGQWLRNLPEQKDPQLEQELKAYRANVERLRDLLPTIHRGLLAEKARLEQERTRVAGAAEWLKRSRQTL